MVNPCAMMIYAGSIANGGEGTLPYIIDPTTSVGDRVSKLRVRTDKMIEPGTAEVEGQDKPNSWFVGFLDDEEHPYAFVVLIEEGGYGIDAAGSVANRVLQEAISY